MNGMVKSSAPDLAAQLLADTQFVEDLARYSEKLLTEKFIRRKYNLTDDAWEHLGEDDALVDAIENEKLRRIRNGSSKRERAQKHIVKGPDVLEKIMNDDTQNSRHRVDAIKALDAIAEPGPQTAQQADRFVIHIDLGEDHKLTIDKPYKPGPLDDDGKMIEGAASQAAINDGSKWKE
jgi:hypothetical protein